LKYEHLYRAPIDDGGALGMETARFRDIYKRIRPHQALDDRTPRQAYLDHVMQRPTEGPVTATRHRAGLTRHPSSSRPATALSAAPVPVDSHVRQLGRRPSAPLDMVDCLAATRSW
jgi:hypothetical protein